MKRFFTLALIPVLLLSGGCSKDFLKRYDKRIVGTWRIADVKRIGFGGDSDNLPFTSGSFIFRNDGSLTYVDNNNTSSEGSWEIVKRVINDEAIRSLHVTAIDFNSGQVKAEFYDDINFQGTDYFKARMVRTFHTYTTHFRR